MPKSLIIALSLLLTAAAFAQSPRDVQFTLSPSLVLQRPTSGTTATLVGTLVNHTSNDLEAVDVEIVLDATRASLFVTPGQPHNSLACTNDGPRRLRCRTREVLRANTYTTIVFGIDPALEGRFAVTGQAFWTDAAGQRRASEEWLERAVFHREVLVTSTADTGAGSLRAAIEHANDVCARDEMPCAIRFAIDEPMPAAGWYTIELQTPLPAVTHDDVSIESERSGERPMPVVELDGSLLTSGHGLELRGKGVANVEGLAIGGFPWDGIAVSRESTPVASHIFRNHIGVRPDGTPNPNGSRGLTFDSPASRFVVSQNQISSNRRSGIFVAGGTELLIGWNGIDRNGASGIFIGPSARQVMVEYNGINRNGHAAVSVAHGAKRFNARQNFPSGNGGLVIDHGLDGFSGYVNRGTHLPAPRLVAATYDAATNTTTVTGTFDAPDPAQSWRLRLHPGLLFADSPIFETTFTGTTFTYSFNWKVSGLTATVEGATNPDWSTSEHSEGVAVH